MTTKAQRAEMDEARALLLKGWPSIKPGDRIYTLLRYRAPSGMSRRMDVYKLAVRDGEAAPLRLTWPVARACGFRYDTRNEAIQMGGAGMDMGFHLVYSLSSVLFRGGFGCIGEGCPSNDHFNGDRDYTPHMTEEMRIGAGGVLCDCHATHWHNDGGYALRHSWL